MNRRTISVIALCSGLLAAASVVPTAQAGSVAWGISVGGPGFSVSTGQPGFYGGRGYYGAPYFPYARPYYRPAYRAIVVAPPVNFLPPVAYPYFTPAPVFYASSPVVYARRSYYGHSSY